MVRIPKNIQKLVAYAPGQRAEEVARQYNLQKVVKLSSNENALGPSPRALAAAREALPNVHRYPDAVGRELRGKLAARLGVESSNLVTASGSESILSCLFRAFFEPGEEILTSSRSFVAVHIMAQANGIQSRTVSLAPDYRFDLERIADAISAQTRVIYIANPNNPTGTIVEDRELREFMARVPADVLVVLDEAYYDFARYMEPDYPELCFRDFENLLNVRTFSKIYGLAGLRLGYAIGVPVLVEAIRKVKLAFEPSLVAQAAALGALSDDEFLQRSLEHNRRGLLQLSDGLTRLGFTVIPSSANFLMVDLESASRAESFHQELLRRGVITRPLAAWDLPNCVRITVGTEEENAFCLEVVQQATAISTGH